MATLDHRRVTYIGAGVHFAAFLDEPAQKVWKIPKTILFSHGVDPRAFSPVKSFTGILAQGEISFPIHESGPDFKNYIYGVVSRITTTPRYETFFANTEIFDFSNLALGLRDKTTHEYHDFSIRQSVLTPVSQKVFCRDKINLAKHIYEINSHFWSYGIGFYRYAELLGYENHGFAAEGRLLGFDLTGVTTSLERMASRIGPGNEKFQIKVRALSKLRRWHVSNNDSSEFVAFCNEYYSVSRLKELWRSNI